MGDSRTVLPVIVGIAVMLSMNMMPAHAGASPIEIDIKPGSDPNSINTNSMVLVPVAILSSISFDATQVDVTTLAFGPGGATTKHNSHLEDVNSDGLIDLVSHYVQKDTGIQSGDTEACLSGETFGGELIFACDSIVTVPPSCLPPSSGDWVVDSSCEMSSSATVNGNLIVQNNSVLTIPSGVTLTVTGDVLVENLSGIHIIFGGGLLILA